MLTPFDYARPSSLGEAISLLAGERSRAMAGGTDVLVNIRSGKDKPGLVVDLKGIPELTGIRLEGGSLWIGALTTMDEVASSPLLTGGWSVLAQAASKVGCLEIRYRATVGGNICNASPGADTAPAFLVLDARVVIAGPNGDRNVPLERFWQGPGRTVLQAEELVRGFLIPPLPAGSRGIYQRRSRVKGMDLAGMGMAVLAVGTGAGMPLPDAEGPVTGMTAPQTYGPLGGTTASEFRIAVGALAPTPVRVKAAEDMLLGRPLSSELLGEVKEYMRNAYSPRATSLRATPEYKKEMAGALLEIALEELTREVAVG